MSQDDWTSDIFHINSKLMLQKDQISAEDARSCLATLEMRRVALDREFYGEMLDELKGIIEKNASSVSQFDVSLLTNKDFFLTPQPISSQDSGISETTKKTRKRPMVAKAEKQKTSKVLVLENVQMKGFQSELVFSACDENQSQESNAQSQDLFQTQSQQEICDDMEMCFDEVPETLTYHETPSRTETCVDLVPETESQDQAVISTQIGEVIEETQQQDAEEEESDMMGGIRDKLKTLRMTDIQQLGEVIDDVSRALTNFKGVVMEKAHQVLEKRKDKPTVRIRTFKKYNPFYDETTEVVIVEKISENEGVDFMREEKWKCKMATMEYLRRNQRAMLNAPQPGGPSHRNE